MGFRDAQTTRCTLIKLDSALVFRDGKIAVPFLLEEVICSALISGRSAVGVCLVYSVWTVCMNLLYRISFGLAKEIGL